MKTTILIVVVLASVLLLVACKGSSKHKIDGERARELVSNGALLLDVRTEGEFEGGHIDGAKLIPVQTLDARLDEVGPKDKPVVVYCASGMRSAKAVKMLEKAGYEEVYDLGSIRSW